MPVWTVTCKRRCWVISKDAGASAGKSIRGEEQVVQLPYETNWYVTLSEPEADRGPRAGSPRGVVDATGQKFNQVSAVREWGAL